ncbi:MAG: hypothetical protein E7214_10910 [Clostridium sp.]|nr:hypothetical protein [Clostridium sp.]
MSIYDFSFYKPFLMLYIFTQYSKISIRELPSRVLATILGVLVVALINSIRIGDERSQLESDIKKSLELIENSLLSIIKNNYTEGLQKRCSMLMSTLAYKIYITRHKKYFTTILGRVQFEVYLNLEYLNLYLTNLNDKYKNYYIDKNDINYIIAVVKQLILFIKDKEKSYTINESIKKCILVIMMR